MKRPHAITILGALNLAFGALGVLGTPMTFVSLFRPPGDNPVFGLLQQDRFLWGWTLVGGILGLLASILLIAAGVGLLKDKRWGRLGSIVYCGYTLVSGVVGIVVSAVFLVGPLWQVASRSSGAEAVGAAAGAIGGLIGGLMGMLYPAVLLAFMFRKNVVSHFHALKAQS
jgi:hypothetical protein